MVLDGAEGRADSVSGGLSVLLPSHVIGPWNTPGTYHLYCTIHQNMQLTVRVK
jgi:plastocyanin